jgi:hypothetical protein
MVTKTPGEAYYIQLRFDERDSLNRENDYKRKTSYIQSNFDERYSLKREKVYRRKILCAFSLASQTECATFIILKAVTSRALFYRPIRNSTVHV